MVNVSEVGRLQPAQGNDSRGRIAYACMTVARLFLGIAMVSYGLDKMFGYQLKVPAMELCSTPRTR